MRISKTRQANKANSGLENVIRHTDAYRKGLNGAQAAYASKKYRGHRVLPMGILKECEDAGIESHPRDDGGGIVEGGGCV
ncbi:hypothetical protein BJ165DRAFT_1355066 [Panaeolus papilionaceus]|nr:hypothetical protein BJ165DRAFT_1355066 [Panaeolus papilionaceus]